MHINRIFIPLVLSLLMYGCVSSPYYQKEYAIPGNEWPSDFKPSFKFEVTDTIATYDMQFLIRHTEAYPYSNIWLIADVKKPGDSTFERTRVEVPLAEPTGKWLGRGMGEIWEQHMPLNLEGDEKLFNIPGMWEIRLSQNMRIDPLPDVLQAGLRVEKRVKP